MTPLLITRELVDVLVTEVMSFGTRRDAETGGFLLACEDQPDHVDILALAGEAGVVRQRDLFTISGGAIERLFTWAGDAELRIRAQVHSHARAAFLSPTDLRYGFDVDGFITAVVPHYAAPSADPGDWGWWQRADGCWRAQRGPEAVDGSVRVFRFDEGGVRAA